MSKEPFESMVGRFPCQVHWGDCDPAGIIFYPTYFCWVDAATWVLMESAGYGAKRMRAEHLAMLLVSAECQLLAPAEYGVRCAGCLSIPRMKSATTRCGACNVAPGPGTRPGLTVVKRNAPWSSVGMRPKPMNPRSSGFFCWSSGCAYLPCEFACQISTRPSLTPTPSPSSSRPSIATRSPLAPRAAMSRVVSQSSPMWRYGPTVWLPLAYRPMSALHRRGIAAAQHDVEAVGERPFRNGVLPVEHRDQVNARSLVGDRVVHRVVLEQRVSRKIHLRDHAREERGAEQREMDVRRDRKSVV